MQTSRDIKSICVYCGSSPGRDEVYSTAAKALAKSLVERDIKLIYGGASVGIMGMVANSVLQLGGQVVGIIPEALAKKEIAHHGLTQLYITKSMHERKSLMAELSDGFIAMPGGIGTLEELFEVWTWAQLGFHTKPCGLLNVDGYFNSLITFLDQTVIERFVKQDHLSMLLVESAPEPLLNQFAHYVPPVVSKWLGEAET